MSVIKTNNISVDDDSVSRARQVEAGVNAMASYLVTQWNQNWDTIWYASNPSLVLKELGENAAEIFELNGHLVEFLSKVLHGRRQDDLNQILAKIKAKPQTTVNEDGTVIIGKPEAKSKSGKK